MIYEEGIKQGTKQHSLSLEDRNKLFISGVEEVESFDERQIILTTSKGSLIIRGTNLHIDKLNLDVGELGVEGIISDLGYEEIVSSNSFWAKLFK